MHSSTEVKRLTGYYTPHEFLHAPNTAVVHLHLTGADLDKGQGGKGRVNILMRAISSRQLSIYMSSSLQYYIFGAEIIQPVVIDCYRDIDIYS